ncbi:hypothetical protein N7527_005570, partial [Penicillium freii]
TISFPIVNSPARSSSDLVNALVTGLEGNTFDLPPLPELCSNLVVVISQCIGTAASPGEEYTRCRYSVSCFASCRVVVFSKSLAKSTVVSLGSYIYCYFVGPCLGARSTLYILPGVLVPSRDSLYWFVLCLAYYLALFSSLYSLYCLSFYYFALFKFCI